MAFDLLYVNKIKPATPIASLVYYRVRDNLIFLNIVNG